MWKTKGFSLLELIIAMGLLAVISVGVISIIGQGPSRTGRDTKREVDLQQVASALVLYRNDNGTYPACSGSANNCRVRDQVTFGTYLTTIPADPRAGREYIYAPTPSGCNGTTTKCTAYSLCASKETSGLATVTCGGTSTCGTGYTCNLQVLSP